MGGNGNDGQSANGFDETSVYVSGSFGRLQLGNNDVATAIAGGVSVVGVGSIIKVMRATGLATGSLITPTMIWV